MKFKLMTLMGLLGVGSFLAFNLVWAESDPRDISKGGIGMKFSRQMIQIRNIMHDAKIIGEPFTNGVRINVTANNKELVESIKEEFASGITLPPLFTPAVKVSAQSRSDGVILTYSTDDPALIGQLRAQGSGLVYHTLRDRMHSLLAGQGMMGGPGSMSGQGMMGGHGGMSAPGFMHGQGRMGAPGFMHGQGWMHGRGGYMHDFPTPEEGEMAN